MNRDKKVEAQKWLEKAKGDLRVAKMILNDDEPVLDLACYLSQQCAEKSLKALLIAFEIRFAYKHDLSYLCDLLPVNVREKFSNFDLDWLSTWETEGRYPGDMPPATQDDAKKSVDMADRIYNMVLNLI